MSWQETINATVPHRVYDLDNSKHKSVKRDTFQVYIQLNEWSADFDKRGSGGHSGGHSDGHR